MGGFSQIPTTPKMILNFSGKYVNLRKMGKYEWHLAQLVVLVVNCGGNYLSTYKAFVRAHACEIGRTKARQVLAVDALEQFLYMMIFQPLIDLSHALAYAVHWPFTAGSSIFHGGARSIASQGDAWINGQLCLLRERQQRLGRIGS